MLLLGSAQKFSAKTHLYLYVSKPSVVMFELAEIISKLKKTYDFLYTTLVDFVMNHQHLGLFLKNKRFLYMDKLENNIYM